MASTTTPVRRVTEQEQEHLADLSRTADKATSPSLNVAAIGAMSDHGYPRNLGLINAEIPLATAAKKGFIIGSSLPPSHARRQRFFAGEYDWTDKYGGADLPSYLAAIERTSYIGDLVWGVQGHDALCCAYLPHVRPSPSAVPPSLSPSFPQNDGYSIYYPNGNSAAEQVNILAIVQHVRASFLAAEPH